MARRYINSVITNLPISVFFFTVVFSINILFISNDFKVEYGMNAVDELVSIYLYYLIRTVLFSFLVSAFSFVFTSKRMTYKQMILTHAFLVLTSVGLIFRDQSGSPLGFLRVMSIAVVIYGVIWFFVIFKEKQFLTEANEILKDNDKAQI